MATALVVGKMIGSRVFLLPSSLTSYGGISIVAWRASRAPAEAPPLTVEDVLPPIHDKQPART